MATHLPKASLPDLEWSDKSYHLIAFAGLSFLLASWLGREATSFRAKAKALLMVTVIAVLYAVFDENTQRLIPGRQYDLLDIAADSLGVVIGIIGYLIARAVLPKWLVASATESTATEPTTRSANAR